MNNENLIKNSERTPNERRELAKKAGQASGEARRKKKLLKDELQNLLDSDVTDDKGLKTSTRTLISKKLIERCLKGDVKAFEVLRDTIGEKPTERFITGSSEEVVKKMEEFFNSIKPEEGGLI